MSSTLPESLGIPIETNEAYIPQGNSVAERGFGTIIGVTRSLILGTPHVPEKLWDEALKAAVFIRNRTSTDVLGGEVPLAVWRNKPLGSMRHAHEWGSLTFKHIEVRHRNRKLTPRAKKMHLAGYNTKNMTYRLWDPERPQEITNSAGVSFREKSARDVGHPKARHDRFPIQEHCLCQGSRLKKYRNKNLPRSQWRLRYK